MSVVAPIMPSESSLTSWGSSSYQWAAWDEAARQLRWLKREWVADYPELIQEGRYYESMEGSVTSLLSVKVHEWSGDGLNPVHHWQRSAVLLAEKEQWDWGADAKRFRLNALLPLRQYNILLDCVSYPPEDLGSSKA